MRSIGDLTRSRSVRNRLTGLGSQRGDAGVTKVREEGFVGASVKSTVALQDSFPKFLRRNALLLLDTEEETIRRKGYIP